MLGALWLFLPAKQTLNSPGSLAQPQPPLSQPLAAGSPSILWADNHQDGSV